MGIPSLVGLVFFVLVMLVFSRLVERSRHSNQSQNRQKTNAPR